MKKLALGLLLYSTTSFGVEVINIGNNWTRLLYNISQEIESDGDLFFLYGVKTGNLWRSEMSPTVRYNCMIESNPIFIAGKGEIDLSIKHQTSAFLFAGDRSELTSIPLFGYQLLNVESEEFLISQVITAGSQIDWKYSLYAKGDAQLKDLFYVTTLGKKIARIQFPVKVDEGLYQIRICPVLEQVDVGIEEIILDVRLY